MPDPSETYLRIVAQARAELIRGGGLTDRLLEQMLNEYAGMLIRIQIEEGEGILTAERAGQLSRSIEAEINRLGRRMGRTLITGVRDSVNLAAEGHRRAIQQASQAAGVQVTASLNQVPRETMRLMMFRRGLAQKYGADNVAEFYKTLINRNITDLAGDVDRYLQSAVGRGVSSQRATRELAQVMAAGDRELLDTLRKVGPRGGRLKEVIEEGIEVPSEQLPKARRMLSDARRIYITETNTNYVEAYNLSAARSPVVEALEWALSGRHHGLFSSPDVCDLLASQDLHALGPGRYYAETVPSLPHPRCMCHTRSVIRPPEAWGRENPTPTKHRAPTEEEVQQALETAAGEHSRSITDDYVRAQTSLVKQRLSGAWETYQQIVAQ